MPTTTGFFSSKEHALFSLKKCIVLLFCILSSLTINAYLANAATPVLFFSDLESGPKAGWNGSITKGAAVSVWGLNFGPIIESSKLSVCGQDIIATDEAIVEWGAEARARSMKRITFFLNASMNDGPGSISVTTSEGTSNSLPFTIRKGNIYFVDDTGNDNNNGTNDTTQAWRNPGKAKDMSAGDICYVREGAYNNDNGGGSLVYFGNGDNGGTPGYPKAWVGYPGETVTLGTDNTLHGFIFKNYSAAIGSYITVAKFDFNIYFQIFSCPFSGHPQGSREYIRLVALKADHQGLEGQASSGNIFLAGDSHRKVLGCYFENLDYHSWDHNIYLNTLHVVNSPQYDIRDIEIAYNEFAGGTAVGFNEGSALKIHGRDDNPNSKLTDVWAHSNYFHDMRKESIDVGAYQQDIYIYNNLFENCAKATSYGQVFQYTPNANSQLTCRFFNNTIVATENLSVVSRFTGGGNSTSISMKNNIFYNGAINTFYSDGSYYGNRSGDKNILYQYIDPTWLSDTRKVDPLFVKVSDKNYSLSSNSPAIDQGADVSSVLTVDYNGVSRGGVADIGAFEYLPDDAASGGDTPPYLSAPRNFQPSDN